MSLIKWVLRTHKNDEEVKKALTEVSKEAHDTSYEIDRINDLLRKDGITLAIYIATGGDRRHVERRNNGH